MQRSNMKKKQYEEERWYTNFDMMLHRTILDIYKRMRNKLNLRKLTSRDKLILTPTRYLKERVRIVPTRERELLNSKVVYMKLWSGCWLLWRR